MTFLPYKILFIFQSIYLSTLYSIYTSIYLDLYNHLSIYLSNLSNLYLFIFSIPLLWMIHPCFVLHPNFTKIWYVKDKTPNFNVSNFFSIRMTQKKWSFFLFFFWKFHFFTFQVWPFWSDKITNLRLPKHNLGGYYYNKVVLEFWNFYFLGVKSAIFE